MSIAVTSWDEIPQADYDAARALAVQIVVERHPEVHNRRGTISDLVLTLESVLAAAGRLEHSRYLRSNSLLEVAADPALSDPDLVDKLFGDYRVTRQAGGAARGSVTIVLSRPVPTTIPAGFVFRSGGRNFITETSFSGRLSSSDVLSSTDRVMVAQTDGTYTFPVDVVSDAIGAIGMLRQGDVVVPLRPVPHVSHAYATRDFVDGRDAESTADMYARLEAGVAARTWSNATNILALVREQEGFEDALVSTIGAGHPEMLRDKHALFPIAYGNRVDVWVKPPRQPSIVTIEKVALYLETTPAGPNWQISLTREDLPGTYAITSVVRKGRVSSAAVAPSSFTRTYNAAAGDPDIVNALETGFSMFQSGTIAFVDTANSGETLVEDETEVDYLVTAVLVEGIDALQAALTDQAIAPPAGDMVVRAAVPCFVSVELEFDRLDDGVPQTDIQAAVSQYVNSTGFIGTLFASRIMTVVAPFLPTTVNLERVRLSGIVFGPDGQRKLYRHRDALTAPDEPTRMVTADTVAFFLDPSDVAINTVL